MLPLRRPTVFLLGLLFLQLTLLQGDSVCRSAGAPQTAAERHGMQHGPGHPHAPAQPTDGMERPDACASMISCAFMLGAPSCAATGISLLATTADLPEPAAARSERLAAPDVPPPRG